MDLLASVYLREYVMGCEEWESRIASLKQEKKLFIELINVFTASET